MASNLEKYIQESTKINDGLPARYQLPLKKDNLDKLPDKESKLRRFTFGKHDPQHQNKTILLVGATGSGKSTLINALVNFVMGVKLEDKVWFEIITDEKDRPQSDSQTSEVSVYEVFGFEGTTVPYSLTIIDTPGYGDTRGIEYDDITTKKLQDLFCVPEGVAVIDAVGLVLKAAENRVDERMAYIFNSVTSLFGKDMEKNIVVMMTHSDGNPPEDALHALEDAKIKCARDKDNEPVYFLFNNRQEKTGSGRAERAARYAFETSENGMKDFTDFLGKSQPQFLKTCVKVMKERIRLTACIQNLQDRVTDIEEKQETIKRNRKELVKYEEEMKKNQNFTIQVTETYKEKVKIDAWWDTKALTCSNCEENCHFPGCTWAWNPSWCEVMEDGRCTSCSGKCPVEDHVKENRRYVTKTRTVTKTKAEMKAKFKGNKKQKEHKTTLLEDLEMKMSDLEQTKNQCLDEAFNIMEKLQEIALNVDAVSTYVHLNFLIEKMEEKGDTEKAEKLIKYQKMPGFQLVSKAFNTTDKRRDIKKNILKKIDDGPPARYQLKLERVNLDNETDEESKLRRFTVGKRNKKNIKTILLVGATGSGKSTLINALVNFVMGVKFEDKVWFEIISDEKDRPQSDSQTTAVSVYEVFGFEGTTVPYSLTIIDTPGYGDTRGIEYDDIITKKLQDLFCVPEGVAVIDAVGLVLKATENRVDERMAYIFNSVMSNFGKDLEKNIVVMMTHSDGGKPTNALQALEDAKIKCARDKNNEPVYFLFNNRQMKSDGSDNAQSAFQTSVTGITGFMKFLNDCQPQSLKTCVEVMKNRIQLTACIQNLKERVENVEMKQEAISKNKEELEKNPNRTIQVNTAFKEKVKIDSWWDTKAVICTKCEENCHYPGCTWAWSPFWCEVMKDGRCTSCSGKCPVEVHVKENWRYVTTMKSEYKEKMAETESSQIEKMEKENADLEQKKNQCLDEAFHIILRLEEIALNVDSVSTFVHLDFLIKKMKEKGDREKVLTLERMKDRMDEKNKAGVMYFLKSLGKKFKGLIS